MLAEVLVHHVGVVPGPDRSERERDRDRERGREGK